ncbi:hypothetical protein GPN2_10641 [Streptomyces murinus]
MALHVLHRLDHQGRQRRPRSGRPAPVLPARLARRPDRRAVGHALGADPGRRTGPGGAVLRPGGRAGPRDRGRRRIRGRALPAGDLAAGRVLYGHHRERRSDPGHLGVGVRMARRGVAAAAGRAGPGAGSARGRRPAGRRPVPLARAPVVPGRLLTAPLIGGAELFIRSELFSCGCAVFFGGACVQLWLCASSSVVVVFSCSRLQL